MSEARIAIVRPGLTRGDAQALALDYDIQTVFK